MELCLLFIANKTVGAIDTTKINPFLFHNFFAESAIQPVFE
jgi:hypothetical protein